MYLNNTICVTGETVEYHEGAHNYILAVRLGKVFDDKVKYFFIFERSKLE